MIDDCIFSVDEKHLVGVLHIFGKVSADRGLLYIEKAPNTLNIYVEHGKIV